MHDLRLGEPTRALELQVPGRDEPLRFVPSCLVVAGYTARDRAAAQRHIDELQEIGVAPPRAVPMFYILPPGALTTATSIEVGAANTTGEAEPVLLCVDGAWYLGVGSDHTDREMEAVDIGASKRACPKVMSSTVLDYAAVEADWDSLRLRSWTGPERTPYQDGPVSTLMTPRSIIDELVARVDVDTEGLVVFCGTVPLSADGFVPAPRFDAQLARPDGEPILHCSYEVVERDRS